MRKKAGPVLAVLLLIIVIVVISVVGKKIEEKIPSKEEVDLEEYYQVSSFDEMAIVWNDTLLENKALYLNGQVYLEYATIHDDINARFYWDKNENILLYTTPEELITVHAGDKSYYVGKTKESAGYEIVKLDADVAYVALDFVEQYSDIEYETIEDPNRVLIRTEWGTIKTANLKQDCELRVEGDIKSPILKHMLKGEVVTVKGESEDFTQVHTADGVTGYIKTKSLSEAASETLSYNHKTENFTHILKDEPISLLWHQVTNRTANGSVAEALSSSKGVNVISPTWFYLDSDEGDIADIGSSDYVNYCHSQGVEVWGLINNLENPEADSTYVLTHTSTRQNLTNQIIAAAIQYNLDGINVDFEALSSEVGDGFIQFIRELSLKCEDNGLILSIDNYVSSPYTQFYNREEQALFGDYVIVMAYDEHYAGSSEGSVASIGFVKDGVKNALAENVPAEQIILGMPFYTRIWALTPKGENGDSAEAASDDYVAYDVSSEAVGMSEVYSRLKANGVEPSWLEESGQNYAQYEKDGITYKIWIEDEAALELKLQVMKENKLAGAAFWKQGLERSSAWDTIIKYLN